MRCSYWLCLILVFTLSCIFEKEDDKPSPKGDVTLRLIKSDSFLSDQLDFGGSLKISTENVDTVLQKENVTSASPKITLSSIPAGSRQFTISIVDANNKRKYWDTCSYVVVEEETIEINIAANKSDHLEYISYTDFRVKNEMEGWSEMDGGFSTYEAKTLKDLINGGADQYSNAGLTKGIYQVMEAEGEKRYDTMIMDLGLSQNAKDLFEEKVNETTTEEKIGEYALDVAKGRYTLNGVEVFAHFKNFFFEIKVTGYKKEDLPQSTLMAEQFLLFHEKRLFSD